MRREKSNFGAIVIILLIIGLGYMLFFSDSAKEISPDDEDESNIAPLKESGVLIEVLDKDGNVIDSNRYAKPTQSMYAQNVWGIPEEDIKYLTRELGVDLTGGVSLRITFTVTNIGNVPLEVEFTEGVVEGSYYG